MRQTDAQKIFTDVIAAVATSPAKITPAALKKLIFERYGLNNKQIKTVIRDLVFSGELTYTYEFGSTFLERSFTKPVRISRYVVLTPPTHPYRSKPQDVLVQIKPGGAFGIGNHPSTRLAIKAIEFVLLDNQAIDKRKDRTVLDIGTGSGVLILTAVLGGMDGGIGIDIDSCARVEAAANVKINGLADRIMISGQAVETINQRFAMVLANLRYPSLKKLLTRLTEITDKRGILILAGLKNGEVDDLLEVYTKTHFRCLWTVSELGWAGMVLQKVG
ncbi:MAG: 50S ribosomal protein L11 methyltransferase [Desulfobacterales bacterium]